MATCIVYDDFSAGTILVSTGTEICLEQTARRVLCSYQNPDCSLAIFDGKGSFIFFLPMPSVHKLLLFC